MNIAESKSHPGRFGNPYTDTKFNACGCNPHKRFVVQLNASKTSVLEQVGFVLHAAAIRGEAQIVLPFRAGKGVADQAEQLVVWRPKRSLPILGRECL
jgi:hypothetical protein